LKKEKRNLRVKKEITQSVLSQKRGKKEAGLLDGWLLPLDEEPDSR